MNEQNICVHDGKLHDGKNNKHIIAIILQFIQQIKIDGSFYAVKLTATHVYIIIYRSERSKRTLVHQYRLKTKTYLKFSFHEFQIIDVEGRICVDGDSSILLERMR